MRFIFVISLFFISFTSMGQNFNRPVPEGFPEYEFIATDTTNFGYYFISPLNFTNANKTSSLGIIDHDGYLIWYANDTTTFYTDFKYHEQFQMFSYIEGGDHHPGRLQGMFMNENLSLSDSLLVDAPLLFDGHELLLLPNGNKVVLVVHDTIMDLSAYTFAGVVGSDTTHVIDFWVSEYDSQGNLIFKWQVIDDIFPTETYDFYGYNASYFDYLHPNAIEVDTDGNFMVSFRHLNAIYKVNRTTGNVMWRLGGKSNDFTFINDDGFSGQHDIRRLQNGNISLFDNGNMADPTVSRGVEYALDPINWTATKVWEYTDPSQIFTRAMGNNQQLNDEQHRLFSWGLLFRPDPSVTLIDNNDNIVNEIYLADSVVTYRTRLYELPFNFPQPDISCQSGNAAVTLTAPEGYDSYEWSNGESTASITVFETGTYMCWVNYGMGMVGSIPFIISDLANPCGVTGVEELSMNENEEIINIYDLLGREVSRPVNNQIYIVRYKNGTVKKEFWSRNIAQ